MKSQTMRIDNQRRAPTLAELCEAVEDGRLASVRSGEYYVIRRNDLRHFAENDEPKLRTLSAFRRDRTAAAG